MRAQLERPWSGAVIELAVIGGYIVALGTVAFYAGSLHNLKQPWYTPPYEDWVIAGLFLGTGIGYGGGLTAAYFWISDFPPGQRARALFRLRILHLAYSAVRWPLFFGLGASSNMSVATSAWCLDLVIPIFVLLAGAALVAAMLVHLATMHRYAAKTALV